MQIRYASLFARKEICDGRNRLSAKYSRRLEILISAFHLNLTYTCTSVAIHPSLISPTPAPFKTMPEAKAYVSSHMDRDRMLIMFPFPRTYVVRQIPPV